MKLKLTIFILISIFSTHVIGQKKSKKIKDKPLKVELLGNFQYLPDLGNTKIEIPNFRFGLGLGLKLSYALDKNSYLLASSSYNYLPKKRDDFYSIRDIPSIKILPAQIGLGYKLGNGYSFELQFGYVQLKMEDTFSPGSIVTKSGLIVSPTLCIELSEAYPFNCFIQYNIIKPRFDSPDISHNNFTVGITTKLF